jgi:hypothetical protein
MFLTDVNTWTGAVYYMLTSVIFRVVRTRCVQIRALTECGGWHVIDNPNNITRDSDDARIARFLRVCATIHGHSNAL